MAAAPQHDTVRGTVAANLRALKAVLRVTDKEIGAEIGMSGNAVNERMRGATECSASDLERFARYFGVEVGRLFEPNAQNPRVVDFERDSQMELALGEFGWSPALAVSA